MTTQTKFTPIGDSVTLTNTTTSGATASITKHPGGNRGELQRVFNSTDVEVFVEFGPAGTTTTVATGFPVASGAEATFEVGPNATLIALDVASNATGDVVVTPGL